MKSLQRIAEKFEKLEVRSKAFFRPQFVREIFGIDMKTAIFWLEVAERFGYVHHQFNLMCPICGRVVASFDSFSEIPNRFECVATENCREFEVTKSLVEKVYARD